MTMVQENENTFNLSKNIQKITNKAIKFTFTTASDKWRNPVHPKLDRKLISRNIIPTTQPAIFYAH